MQRRYATADVFTAEPLGGNPVAVVLDAEGLTTAQMQALAAEFNYVETTFVLSPADARHTAHVRIFTPDREVPFAGHPNIGTAFLLAQERVMAGEPLPECFTFEEAAGLVTIDLMQENGRIVGAELLSPQPLVRHTEVNSALAAACLSLAEADVRTDAHVPQVVSVGLPFLVLELASREVLRRARPDRSAYDALFPLDGARAVYAYVRDVGDEEAEHGCDLHSRMFTWRLVEDPATGSATAAVTALLAELRGTEVRLHVRQGEDMGRPSTLLTRSAAENDGTRAYVGGRCAAVFSGVFDLA
ncbi:PhzF family phenazine biosynthesis protein [Novosphingopyxis sp.]|uniref:PhzF family phenazine biosynthesis protein n=1 Tax=Novosphingopyxis sp. TaxID=2709690 RepID=UPI003B5CB9FE